MFNINITFYFKDPGNAQVYREQNDTVQLG